MTFGAARRPHDVDLPAPWVALAGRRQPDESDPRVASVLTPEAGALKLWLLGEEAGRPAVAKAGRCAAIVAGRLHDRDRLAALVGSPLAPATDSELVLSAYLNGGEPALQQLRGAFVVLVFDGRRDHFLALRDPLGSYPLFFATRPESLLLSPSQEQLLLQKGVSRGVDRVAAAGWILGRPVDETFFVDIARLTPGHVLRFDGDSVRTERYWRPRVLIGTEPIDVQSVQEQFDLLLSRAVDRCLDVGPAGVRLSGGIDSAAIAAVATDRSRCRGLPDPVALSITFPEPASDESTTQRAVASALGIAHVLVPWERAFGPEGPLLEALAMAKWLPVPPNPWDSAFGLLARTAAELGCGSTIGGEATEWLAHERFYSADLVRRLDLAGLRRLFAAERAFSGHSRREVTRTLLWTYGARALLLDLAARFPKFDAAERVEALRTRQRTRSIPAWLVPDPSLRRELAERWLSTVLPLGGGSFYVRARLGLLDSPYMTVSMDSYYERSRQFEIEWLDGFQDPELIEFLLTVPPELLVAGGLNKSLAQASIRRRLPEFDLRLLRSARFDAALEELLVAQVQQALEQLGGLPILASLGVVDPAPLLELAATGKVARPLAYHRLWYAVSLEGWLRARL